MEIHRAAAILYAARKSRDLNPDGSFDSKGRFYPSPVENSDDYTCTLRSPSRSWPYSYMVGARTKKHVIALAVAAPAFVIAEATKAKATVTHTAVSSMLRAIDKVRQEQAEAEAARAVLVRKRADEEAAEQRLKDEAAAAEQHAIDMEIDGDLLAQIAA